MELRRALMLNAPVPSANHQPTAPPDSDIALEEYLSRPDDGVRACLATLEGDLIVLGAGGKIGLSISRMARRALDEAGRGTTRVIAVSRFGDRAKAEPFRQARIETISSDILSDGELEKLPDVANVLYLAGFKFGSSGEPAMTWAMNTYLPTLVARRFAGSRIVALSTGNVYAFSDVRSRGSIETDAPAPVGEYAQSCLGRERMFQYFSSLHGTAVTLVRLNYANDLRYGVLVDIAQKVLAGAPIDVTMGHVNVTWQGDANAAILRSFNITASPPAILNVAGPEVVTVRSIATRFAELLDRPSPVFLGEEAPTALLSDSSKQRELFGEPSVPLDRLMKWSAAWLGGGGRVLGKPTGFEKRSGKF